MDVIFVLHFSLYPLLETFHVTIRFYTGTLGICIEMHADCHVDCP